MIHKVLEVGSQLSVGAIAAAATVPSTLPTQPWVGLVISCVTIAVSVVLTGVVNHRLHRSLDKKTDAEGERYEEMTQGEHIKNTVRLLELKEAEIKTLLQKVDMLTRQVSVLRDEVDSLKVRHVHELASLKAENAQLTLLLGDKLKELVQLQSLKGVFAALQKDDDSGEKAGS